MKTYLKSLKLLRREKKLAILLTIGCFVLACLTLIEPFFFKEIINNLISLSNNFIQIFIVWMLIVAIDIVLFMVISSFASYIANKIYYKLWQDKFKDLLSLSVNFFENNNSGTIIRNFERGLDNLYMLHMKFFRHVLLDTFIILIIFPILFYLNYKMGILFLLSVPILILFTMYGNKKTTLRQKEADEQWSHVSGIAYDSISNIFLLKSFLLKDSILNKISKKAKKAYESQVEAIKWWGFISGFSRSVGLILNVIVFFLGGILYTKGEMTIGEIIMFVSFSGILINSFNSIFWNINEYLWQKEKINFFFNLIEEKPKIVNSDNIIKLENIKGNIEFKNVCFSYGEDIDTLDNISFKIKAGETIAFVGHTGSGKSTTANLISRFYDIQEGDILIDGNSIKNIDIEFLRKNIAIVFQENTFFNGSFLENLKIDERVTKEEIKTALKKAHILDVVMKNNKGLNQVIGDRGIKLSGGEKQRLSIARAILKDSPILILDEATSALDAKTENKIQSAISNLIKGRTTIIIAHRLSTIKKVDRIFVFKEGKIIEMGNFESLMKNKGAFYELTRYQTAI
ncbi:MAG: ABC transporter transmembrane domain-containing protein [Candidatus Pacebacteria bacterium]|nr:ABC transporter transmembrane domain-containing protein [Candidatus Paceibacterota bacterium]